MVGGMSTFSYEATSYRSIQASFGAINGSCDEKIQRASGENPAENSIGTAALAFWEEARE